ncbi:MAG: type I restriction endonuclease subunit R [Chloroflexi bacterium]|nr:type I restriction endonuclease subunit R [Chloroflexota bacterium]MYB83352.1 type I restriction endonuclease subunit R [Chloroflexota bacterium]
MTSHTDERAFESTVESKLIEAGWRTGDRAEWDVERALFPSRAAAFIRETQPDEWERMASLHGDDVESLIAEALARELDLKGSLEVLRQGFRFYGRTFRIAYFAPSHGLNPDALARFGRNELTVTRQVPCHPGKADTVDLVLALNGVPVATCELKNPMTGQTWRDAVRQYRQDRNPDAPLFSFKRRTLVHFAVDPDEVHMTTRLTGAATSFLPFNRGSSPGSVHCGAGNPQHPSGHRTGYLWQEVLTPERFLDVIGSYVFLETREEKVEDGRGVSTVKRETMVFPRYHQLDAVRGLVESARADGPGRNYLIQHSAGSGKTNSISWLAHRLASLHTTSDERVFDCIVIISDRRVLDHQLQDAVYQIEHAQGVVKAIDKDSQQLAQALVDETKVVITTLQKFPFVMRGLLRIAGADADEAPSEAERAQTAAWRKAISGRRYAVIVDEAHSSQTGESARELKAVLGSRAQAAAGDAEDWEDGLNAVVESRGPQPNLSFFAFTATPKGKTVELFGRPGASGKPEPFHVYSMRQAIEEKFILDVLQRYVDYDAYYRIVKQAEDDPNLPKRRTAIALAKFMTLHPHNIEQKTEVIVEHFRNHVRHHMEGRAKAMVVTASRLHAVRYMQAFQRYIARRGYDDVRPLVAFSGTVHDPDTAQDFTEPGMNTDVVTGRPIGESALPGRFASSDYQILLVAEKYQTGFDQPLLQAMYVDKRLDGVQAVQTLSRLNRIAPGKEPPFVLDFVNDPEDIRAAFAPYYDRTELLEASDPYRLDELKHELDGMQVYHHAEVEAFAKVFYLPPAKRSHDGHARIEVQLQPARDRFASLDEDEQTRFRDRLSTFVSLYSFLSQLIPYADGDLERLSSFGRALLPHLTPDGERAQVNIGDEVELEYYRLQRVSSGVIRLGEEDAYVTSPTEVGTGDPEEEKAPLSEIIERLNERFGTDDFTDEDRLFFEQVKARAIRDEAVRRMALANSLEKFTLGIRPEFGKFMMERMSGNDALVTRYLDDGDFQEIVANALAEAVYEAVLRTQPALPLDGPSDVDEPEG